MIRIFFFYRSNQWNKYKKYYNAKPKITKPFSLGIYEFNDEKPKIISFSEFKKRQHIDKNKTLRTNSLFDKLFKSNHTNDLTKSNPRVMNKLEKNITKEMVIFNESIPELPKFKHIKKMNSLNKKSEINLQINNKTCEKNAINCQKSVNSYLENKSNLMINSKRNEKIHTVNPNVISNTDIQNESNEDGAKIIYDNTVTIANTQAVKPMIKDRQISIFIENKNEQNHDDFLSVKKMKDFQNTINFENVPPKILKETNTDEIEINNSNLSIRIIREKSQKDTCDTFTEPNNKNRKNIEVIDYDKNKTCSSIDMPKTYDLEKECDKLSILEKKIAYTYKNSINEENNNIIKYSINSLNSESQNMKEPNISLYSKTTSEVSSSEIYNIQVTPTSEHICKHSQINETSKMIYPNNKQLSLDINKYNSDLKISPQISNQKMLALSKDISDTEISENEITLNLPLCYTISDSDNEIGVRQKSKLTKNKIRKKLPILNSKTDSDYQQNVTKYHSNFDINAKNDSDKDISGTNINSFVKNNGYNANLPVISYDPLKKECPIRTSTRILFKNVETSNKNSPQKRMFLNIESKNDIIPADKSSFSITETTKNHSNQFLLKKSSIKNISKRIRRVKQKSANLRCNLRKRKLHTPQKLIVLDSNKKSLQNFRSDYSFKSSRVTRRYINKKSIVEKKKKLSPTKMKKIDEIFNYKMVKNLSGLKMNENKNDEKLADVANNKGTTLSSTSRLFRKLYTDSSDEVQTDLKTFFPKFKFKSPKKNLKPSTTTEEKINFFNCDSDTSSSPITNELKKLSLETNSSAVLFPSSDISSKGTTDLQTAEINNSLNTDIQHVNETVNENVSFDRVNEMIKLLPRPLQNLNELSTEEDCSDFTYSSRSVLSNTPKESDASPPIYTTRPKIIRKRKKRNILRTFYENNDSSEEDSIFRDAPRSWKQKRIENIVTKQEQNLKKINCSTKSNFEETNNVKQNIFSNQQNKEIDNLIELRHPLEDSQEKNDVHSNQLKYKFFSEDEYGSEEITSDLNDSLLRLSNFENNKG